MKLKKAIFIFFLIFTLNGIACSDENDIEKEYTQFKKENPSQDKPCRYIIDGECFK
jgi:hypothetical protein